MTPARTDLPAVGDRIAVLHGCRTWYFGPLTVTAVDESKKIVEARPDRWEHPGVMVFAPIAPATITFSGGEIADPGKAHPLDWQKLEDLPEGERP